MTWPCVSVRFLSFVECTRHSLPFISNIKYCECQWRLYAPELDVAKISLIISPQREKGGNEIKEVEERTLVSLNFEVSINHDHY